MKRYLLIAISILVCACGGGDDDPAPNPTPTTPNTAPTVPNKVYPTDGLLCTENPLGFIWDIATDSDGDAITYEVQVSTKQDFSSDVQTKTTSSTTTNITLIKGVAYYWRVRSKDNKNNVSAYSSSWKYYTEGEGISNHIPFAPTLISPTLNSTLTTATSTLTWSSSDVDNDPLTYDVYFGTANPPALVLENTSDTTYDVNLNAATTYYWKIVAKDDNGAQAIGQIWYFTTQ